MTTIGTQIKGWLSLLPQFTFKNFAEVLILAFIIYEFLLLIQKSHAWTLLKGIIVILLFTFFAFIFKMDVILWILEKVSAVAVIAGIVIFQPELRDALERLGKQPIVPKMIMTDEENGIDRNTISEISKAAFTMGRVKTGALMVIERKDDLQSWIDTGIKIDGEVTAALLINIFEKNTPLHDGAVIIRGTKVTAATCLLPLSDNMSISKDLGTRHRAAIGMSEKNDSYTVVVSEETGNVSLAKDGILYRMNDYDMLMKELSVLVASSGNKSKRFFGRHRKEKANGK
ncbi:MAG: diadenylate cyclase CdaA [Lachnospiraceae bacterium]|nr:diadenylate cyclase CdaA [Lachnospiraceae bacterium]